VEKLEAVTICDGYADLTKGRCPAAEHTGCGRLADAIAYDTAIITSSSRAVPTPTARLR
jgi:hypothetical protein